MTELNVPGYAEYPEAGPGEPQIHCFVSHPDAGGPCEEPAVVEVYSLTFCQRHSAEATTGALAELAEDVEKELDILAEGQLQRHLPNRALARLLTAAEPDFGPHIDHDRAHDAALREAYPPLEGRTDPDTLAHDWDEPAITPVDWWHEAHWLLCRFMRQAHERSLPHLVEDLEPLRERAAAQILLAEEAAERRHAGRR